jgi:hypothetical protein
MRGDFTTRFWYPLNVTEVSSRDIWYNTNVHQVTLKVERLESQIIYNFLIASKPKYLNRRATID